MRAHSLTKENKIDIIGLQAIYGNNREQFPIPFTYQN